MTIYDTEAYKARRAAGASVEDALLDTACGQRDELIAALQLIVKEIGPSFGRDEDEPGTLNIVARAARAALAKVSA